MKKLLAIMVLGLMWNGNAFANCKDAIQWNWKKGSKVATFSFLNNSNKDIQITNLYIYKDKSLLKQSEPGRAGAPGYYYTAGPLTISKYGKIEAFIGIKEFQSRFITGADYSCKY